MQSPWAEVLEDEAEETLTGWPGESEASSETLAAIAERIAATSPVMEFEDEKPKQRWSRCFKAADIERARQVYKDNAAAAAGSGGDRCSCIVMLNVALGQLLKLKKKQVRARGTSNRKVWMATLTTETIEKAMAMLVRKGYARAAIKIEFFDKSNRTAGTLKPERLKKSVQKTVLDLATVKGCWYAFGLSILDGYHSVLLLVDRTGPNGKIFWLDQFSADIDDDVTTTLDQRITDKTRTWWQAVKDRKNVGYNTTVRVWPLRKLI